MEQNLTPAERHVYAALVGLVEKGFVKPSVLMKAPKKAGDSKLTKVEGRILRALMIGQPIKVVALANSLGLAHSTVGDALRRLKEAGRVSRLADGTYRLKVRARRLCFCCRCGFEGMVDPDVNCPECRDPDSLEAVDGG